MSRQEKLLEIDSSYSLLTRHWWIWLRAVIQSGLLALSENMSLSLQKMIQKITLKYLKLVGDFQESFMLIFLSQSENPCSNVDTLTSSETFDEPGLSDISKVILKSLQNDCYFQVVAENAWKRFMPSFLPFTIYIQGK